jgi:hypothetical protein
MVERVEIQNLSEMFELLMSIEQRAKGNRGCIPQAKSRDDESMDR